MAIKQFQHTLLEGIEDPGFHFNIVILQKRNSRDFVPTRKPVIMTIQNQEIDPSNIAALTFEQGEGKEAKLTLIFKNEEEVSFTIFSGKTKTDLVRDYDDLQAALMELGQKPSA